MKKLFNLFIFMFLLVNPAFGGQSVIIQSEGTASMGDDKSRKQTIAAAKRNAKRNATENVATYIETETVVKNYMTEKDLIEAYSRAMVKILEVINGQWFKDPIMGESYQIVVKAEITPKTEKLSQIVDSRKILDDPRAPLFVKAWANKNQYKKHEKIKIYVKSNKPFYLRIVYKDVKGDLLQLLPNPYRTENYFNGGTMYEIPSGQDEFELEVSPPFGMEKVLVYTSTTQLGNINLTNAQSVYKVNENEKNLGIKTRGVKLKKKTGKSSKISVSEFFETAITIATGE